MFTRKERVGTGGTGEDLFAFRGNRAAAAATGLTSGSTIRLDPVRAGLARTMIEAGEPAGWTGELGEILESVPFFAIWQIETLERCFRRYCQVLQFASRDVQFRRGCIELMANAERIAGTLEYARQTRQWPPFNRAAFELRQDCQHLLTLIGNGYGGLAV